MNAPALILMDVDQHAGLPFPRSLPEFQRLFPGDAACAEYLEKVRWGDGFVCPHCGVTGEPFRISTRPGVLACRNCRRQTGLTVGTVMERSHTPLSTWFWAAYLVASQTQGMSAVQFQRQLGLTRYETAFGILHKLRADGELGRIAGDADTDKPGVGRHVVDAIGRRLAQFLVDEVMHVDVARRAFRAPVRSAVLEVADQLFFLRIDGDDRLTVRLRRNDVRVDVLELRVAVGMF